jgi:DnaJ-domain-containing protein 1
MVNERADGRSRSKSAGRRAKSEPKLGIDYTQTEVDTIVRLVRFHRFCLCHFKILIRIRRCKSYYEILEVKETATDVDLKKSYRKLALVVHPDKCQAPNATDAFKGTNLVFQCDS